MSAIDELIAELCPDGVEYRKLGDVSKYIRGITYNKHQESLDGEGWRVLRANNIDLFSGTLSFNDVKVIKDEVNVPPAKLLRAGDVFICAGSGSKNHVGKVAFVDEDLPFTFGGFMGVIRVDSQDILPKFAYHVLRSDLFRNYLAVALDSTTINNLNAKIVNAFEIPVPPIEVQREIVRILDAFTELTDTMTEELEARKAQYAYYRDRLLSLESLEALDGKPVEMVRLGDVGAFYGGLTGKSKEDFKEGSSLFVPYTNVYNNAAVDFENLDTVNVADGERQHEIAYGDVLITGSSETPDDCGMTSVVMQSPEVQTYLNSFCFGWRPNSLEAFEPGYLKYAFRAYGARRQIVKTANGVTRFNISKEAFGRVEIPVPSLATQQRVVDILDRFDALTTSLTDGLPAEIEARRTQYGYYRDRLLDFPRKEVAAS